jgi:hypothetical protein
MSERETWLKNKKKNYENSISSIMSEMLEDMLANRPRIEAAIITNWNKIFGEDLASKIFYKKLIFTDKMSNKAKLYIEVKKENMLEISYSKDLLVERITNYFGYKTITEISVSEVKNR